MYATPDQQRRAAYPRPAAGSPFTATATETRHSANAARRAALAPPATPLGRVLHAERAPTASPRRVRHRSWTTRLRDWPSNALLSLETSVQLVSFDAIGYPLGATLHLVHLAVRLPALYAALPTFSDWWQSSSSSTPSRYHPRVAPATADARLEALILQRQAAGSYSASTWWFSLALIMLSIANVAYLVTRRRKYQMVLRRDPLSSPNAKQATLRFAPDQADPVSSRTEKLRRRVLQLVGWSKPANKAATAFPVQELDVWVPDHALWSLRLFTLYSPPVAVMYHLLSPSNFLPMLLCGGLFVAQTFGAVYLYSTLVSDRAALQAEVMHEYNAKFVHPRVFVPKRDACVSTSEAEMVSARDLWRGAPPVQRQHSSTSMSTSTSSPRIKSGVAGRWSSSTPVRGRREIEADVDDSEEGEIDEEEEEEEVVQRGSGRKVHRRRRQSEMQLRRAVLEEQQQQQQQHRGGGDQSDDGLGSAVVAHASPLRKRQARASMFG